MNAIQDWEPQTEARRAALRFLDQAKELPNEPENRHVKYKLMIAACEADPTWWQVWYTVAHANREFKAYPTALAYARRASRCEMTPAERADALSLCGWLLHCMGRDQEAWEVLVPLVEQFPEHLGLLVNLSCVQHALGNDGACYELTTRAHDIDPDNANVELALSFAERYLGNLASGLKHFDSRFRVQLKEYESYPLPRWQGQPVETLWVAADQGMGDALSYARFLPQAAARAERVLFAAQPALMNLFAAMLAPWKNVMILPQTAALPAASAWTSTVGLPAALGLTSDEIRETEQVVVPEFTGMLLPKRDWDAELRVGLCWRGAKEHESDRWRSMPFEYVAELLDLDGVEFYNLQVGEFAREMHNHGAAALMTDLAPYIGDASDTVGFMRQLDLVVTIDSFLAHLAGALDTECWVLLSQKQYDPCYAGRRLKPAYWYDHLLFWQNDDWRPTIRAVRQALEQRRDG